MKVFIMKYRLKFLRGTKIANQVNIDNLENIIKLLNKNDHLNENKIIENFRNDYFF